jgi:hypothetical protein
MGGLCPVGVLPNIAPKRSRMQAMQSRSSLLATILNGHWRPSLGLLIASVLFPFLWETANAHHLWIWTNWPLPQWQFLQISGLVLLAWPLQYVMSLSLGFLAGRDFWA